MAVETTHPANAAAPASGNGQGASTAAPAAAPASMASASAMSFEDMVAEELGEESSVKANPETPQRRSQAGKPAAAPQAAAEEPDPESNPDDDNDNPDDSDVYGETDATAGDDADGTEEGNPEDDPEAGPDEDTELEDLPPEHFQKLPKWVQKRLGKVSATVQELRGQLAERSFAITPTPDSPLAHVDTVEDLQEQVNLAKQVRQWCKENPEGGVFGKNEYSAEDVAARLAFAERIIEAAPDWRTRVTNRETAKPWEQAKKVCPEMFQAGTTENGFAVAALELCPQLKTRVPNWEMLLASAVRGMKQHEEEKTGKVKYVRMEIGKDGKWVPPVKAQGTPKPGTKPAPPAAGRPPAAGNAPARPRPPVTPGGTPPPMRSARPGAKPDTAALVDRYAASKEAEDFAALVAAEMS